MSEDPTAELERLRLENQVLRARRGILDAGAITRQNAEIDNLNALSAKLTMETRLYPIVVIGGLIAACVAGAKLIWGS